MRFNKRAFMYMITLYTIGIILVLNVLLSFNTYKNESLFIMIAYFIVITVYGITIIKDGFEIFYPVHFVTILYLCIFIFCPIYLINEGRTGIIGTDVMDGCIRATIVFIISYIAFALGYLMNKAPNYNKFRVIIKNELDKNFKKKLMTLCVSIWSFGLLINLYFLLKGGMDLSYIFSLGLSGTFNLNGSMDNASFISNFGYFMVVPWLYILYYSDSKIFKFIITFITGMVYLIRGFRFIIIIMALSYILCYYRKKRKHPSVTLVVLLILLSLIFISVVGYMRHGLRTGTEVNWDSFGIEQIVYALETNFNIYKPFYGLVNTYPLRYSYTYGQSMIFDTITHFIPRAIWSNKPLAKYSTMAIAMKNSTNEFTYDVAGMAWPNLGEYYMEFGIIGCVILMFIYGYILKKSINLFKSSYIDDVIIYSIFFGFNMQIITRGYTPTIVGLILFLYFPLIIIRMFFKKVR